METPAFGMLPERDQQLIAAARDVAKSAYAPYSGFAVGSAVRAAGDTIATSANLENASFGLTICAEAGALAAANAMRLYDRIEAVAIVGYKFLPNEDSSQVVTPCGRCRQLISESAQLSGTDVVVFACSGDLKKIEKYRISELLPHAFGPGTVGAHVAQHSPGMPRRLKASNR